VTIEGQAWYQKSDTDSFEGDDEAFGANISSPNTDGFSGGLEYRQLGENYFPAMGFANRVGIKQAQAELGHTYRFSRGALLRSIANNIEFTTVSDTDGNIQTEEIELELAQIENQKGDQTVLLLNNIREVLVKPFKIADGITIPLGDYSFQRYGIELESGGQRRLLVTLGLEDGGFYGGNRKTAELTLNWRPSPYFTSVLEYEFNDIDLPQGNFNTHLVRLRTNIAFTPEWAWISTIQYDNQSALLGVNSRVQWIPRAGSEFYIIYNGGWRENEYSSFDQLGQSATMKVGHTFRF
jgi:hypothetical protein